MKRLAPFLLLLLVGCVTAEKAGNKIRKYGEKFPAVTAKYCNEKYPIIINPPKVDSIAYANWVEKLRKEIENIPKDVLLDTFYLVDTIPCSEVNKLAQENSYLKKLNKGLNDALIKQLNNPPPPITIETEKADSSLLSSCEEKYKAIVNEQSKDLRKERMVKNVAIGAALVLLILHLVRIILKR